MKKEELKKVTIYTQSMFGINKVEARLKKHGKKDYAQYKDAPYILYIKKRAKISSGWQGDSRPYALIIEGWGHVDPASALTEKKAGNIPGITVQETRLCSFDEGYIDEFNELINEYLKKPEVKIVADYRYKKGEVA